MLPLIGIAAGIIPEILRLISGDRAGTVASSVAGAVRDITGASDPAAAQAALADAKIAADLKERLAQIALDATKVQSEESDAKRQSELDTLKAGLSDTQGARGTTVALKQAGSNIAWGAPVVSVIVTVGFFALLVLLLTRQVTIADPNVAQLLNLAVGALLAGFSQVISYWIGSSAGSRAKDDTISSVATSVATPQRIITTTTTPVDDAAKPDNFPRCLSVVLAQEGGYVDDPVDKGGPTKFGITSATLAAWRGVPTITASVIQALTEAEAGEIYRSRYWLPMACPQLPAGADLMVLDFGVNAGTRTSVQALQRAVGVTADGSLGPITLSAVAKWDVRKLIQSLATTRIAYYRQLADYEHFGKGWENRVAQVLAAAMAMV